MEVNFKKYSGTGNDFIIIDNRNLVFSSKAKETIEKLCNRNFGIGADGLILIENSKKAEFKMVFYNSDGNLGSFCGNGSRCAVSFYKSLKGIDKKVIFEAYDGLHLAEFIENKISIRMSDVLDIKIFDNHVFIDTGSPHHIVLVDDLNSINVNKLGSKISNGPPYFEKGTNVNFVKIKSENEFNIRTYERGVESETLSCGTGATAVALAMFQKRIAKKGIIKINTKGGELLVNFKNDNKKFNEIYLIGPADHIFSGKIKI